MLGWHILGHEFHLSVDRGAALWGKDHGRAIPNIALDRPVRRVSEKHLNLSIKLISTYYFASFSKTILVSSSVNGRILLSSEELEFGREDVASEGRERGVVRVEVNHRARSISLIKLHASGAMRV